MARYKLFRENKCGAEKQQIETMKVEEPIHE